MGCTHSVPKNKSNVPIENPYSKIHRQVRKEEIESNKMLKMSDVVVPNNLLVSADDFEIGSYLQEGGMGKGKVPPFSTNDELSSPLSFLFLR